MIFSHPHSRPARARLKLIGFGVLLTGAIIVTVSLSMSPAPALSVAHDAARECHEYFAVGNYARAGMNCVAAAAEGDAVSQAALAWMYRNGKGMPKNQTEENRWSKAALEPALIGISTGTQQTNAAPAMPREIDGGTR